MSEALHQQEFLVLSNEASIHNKASIYSISNYLQEAARAHAENLGLGMDLLRTKKQFWVLTRMHFEIDTYPKPGDKMLVETWPKGNERLFALRDFRFYLKGQEIGRATSTWALLQLPARRPAGLHEMSEVMHARAHIHAIPSVPSKLESPQGETITTTHRVTYSELDQNGHVNNTRYINWMLDSLPYAFHQKHMVRNFQLNYLSEVFPEQTLTINRQQTATNTFLFEVKNDDSKILFRGRITFA
jgi:medium-chain acyl-[acyl-carrier-protein] hydrolase